MVHALRREDSAVSNWVILLVLVVVVAVVLGAYYTFLVPKAGPAPLKVQPGDNLIVAYIGYFQDTGYVFDTSLASIAMDNASWPKAAQFSWRTTWSNLTFTDGAGTVVKGFDDGIIGMQQGETKTIIVPPALGYGPMDMSKIFVHSVVEAIPVRVTMNATAFQSTYGESAVSGSNVSDPVYRWTAQVTILNGIITVTNSPSPGETVMAYGLWPATVLSIDDTANNGTGVIWIQNHITPAAVDALGATLPNGSEFYVYAVDPSAGTYTLNFNKQVVGRTLVFQATVLHISRTI